MFSTHSSAKSGNSTFFIAEFVWLILFSLFCSCILSYFSRRLCFPFILLIISASVLFWLTVDNFCHTILLCQMPIILEFIIILLINKFSYIVVFRFYYIANAGDINIPWYSFLFAVFTYDAFDFHCMVSYRI